MKGIPWLWAWVAPVAIAAKSGASKKHIKKTAYGYVSFEMVGFSAGTAVNRRALAGRSA
jgi:hypothetical protein